MQEFKEKVQSLIDKYSPKLSKNGLRIQLSKHYFEEKVWERSGGSNAVGAVLNYIERARDHKKEKENGYNYERNRYHCIVISIIPSNPSALKRAECRDYAFLLEKVERAHIGQEPRKISYEKDKVLSKIERRISKILKKSQRTTPEKICRNNIFDALRYSHGVKYQYKSFFLGKDRFAWDLIFGICAGVLTLGIIFIGWFVSNLFRM